MYLLFFKPTDSLSLNVLMLSATAERCLWKYCPSNVSPWPVGTHTGSFQRLLLQSNSLGSAPTYSSQRACLYQCQTQPGANEEGVQFFWSSSLHPTMVSLNVALGCSTQPLDFLPSWPGRQCQGLPHCTQSDQGAAPDGHVMPPAGPASCCPFSLS